MVLYRRAVTPLGAHVSEVKELYYEGRDLRCAQGRPAAKLYNKNMRQFGVAHEI